VKYQFLLHEKIDGLCERGREQKTQKARESQILCDIPITENQKGKRYGPQPAKQNMCAEIGHQKIHQRRAVREQVKK